jgi:16S rRNA (guanine527-N7)-methyltransferase
LTVENVELSALITHGAAELGVSLPSGSEATFCEYFRFLEERGERTNLTAVAGVEDVARLHFLDSLALLNATQFHGARVIDIGSGAGFPGIPLKIAEPSIDLTLLDATGKKVAFLSELCDTLSIKALCIHARAEDMASKQNMRERYDIAVSRAVARLNVLCELCLPFVRINGLFIAMKGIDSADELVEASSAIAALGAELRECFDYSIPGTDITHRAVLIRKVSATPDKYPRRFARISKSPL